MKKSLISICVFAAVSMLAGCVSPNMSGSSYNMGEARRSMEIRMATVESVRAVKLESHDQTVGAMTGAAAGGIIGAGMGGGRGNKLATLGGVVAGGVLGAVAEKNLNSQEALEIVVKTDDGRMFAVVQGKDEYAFAPGERVRLIGPNNNLRVSK